MRIEFDESVEHNVVVLDGTEGCEQVVDACIESGALAYMAELLRVRFPGQQNEYITRAELRRRVLERTQRGLKNAGSHATPNYDWRRRSRAAHQRVVDGGHRQQRDDVPDDE